MEVSLAKPALLRKPLLLKDYLLDDLSSCSSSGFRSYPRRQCCTTVRFLLEIDLKNNPPRYIQKPPRNLKSPSKPLSSSPSSPFQRASTAFINAVKSSSSLSNKIKLTLLPRTLSRKLLKRSFWKRPDRKGIKSCHPINQLDVKNSSPPLDFTGSPTSGDSRSSTSDSNFKSNSWSDTDLSASDVSTNGNSAVRISNQSRHHVASVENERLPRHRVISRSKRGGVLVGGDYSATETTTSSNSSTSSNNFKCPGHEEEKEQFSPVSVLECPFDDDDEVSSSPFQHRIARMEGTKKRLMRKIKKFERLTQLEPVNLETRIVLSESDRDSDRSPHCHSSESAQEDFIVDSEDEENQAAMDKSFKLLRLAEATMPSICGVKLKVDYEKLLLDFFKEEMEMAMEYSSPGHAICIRTSSVKLDHELLNVAKDWIMGQPQELFLGWEVRKNREAYIRDMERTGQWRKKLDEEKQVVALELAVEVFAALINELCHDLLSS